MFILPESEILQQSVLLRQNLLIAVGVCLLMMALITFFLSDLITKRIKLLRTQELNAPEIQDAVSDLARFYKISLSKGETLIRLREELTPVSTYVNIQNLRFDNAIDFSVEIPSEYLDCYIPKIILQPLIENAILHGIMQKDSRKGEVRITSATVQDENGTFLILQVWDDGPGIFSPVLTDGFEKQPDAGFSLGNVDARLKIYFGKDCGLSFPPNAGRRCSGFHAYVYSSDDILHRQNRLL